MPASRARPGRRHAAHDGVGSGPRARRRRRRQRRGARPGRRAAARRRRQRGACRCVAECARAALAGPARRGSVQHELARDAHGRQRGAAGCRCDRNGAREHEALARRRLLRRMGRPPLRAATGRDVAERDVLHVGPARLRRPRNRILALAARAHGWRRGGVLAGRERARRERPAGGGSLSRARLLDRRLDRRARRRDAEAARCHGCAHADRRGRGWGLRPRAARSSARALHGRAAEGSRGVPRRHEPGGLRCVEAGRGVRGEVGRSDAVLAPRIQRRASRIFASSVESFDALELGRRSGCRRRARRGRRMARRSRFDSERRRAVAAVRRVLHRLSQPRRLDGRDRVRPHVCGVDRARARGLRDRRAQAARRADAAARRAAAGPRHAPRLDCRHRERARRGGCRAAQSGAGGSASLESHRIRRTRSRICWRSTSTSKPCCRKTTKATGSTTSRTC